ncbi:MAG: RagB/SusD family nutrient uptake outer membrane protein [Prevotella sp.]|nr:RagB/SusD family nutrient uptake outer membrane protein [Prevotella sp.]
MITKTIKSICAICVICGIASCSDFLDLKPLNDVVLENYWTKKSDVTSVLMGCYESLYSEESVIRMGLWGEARSDNMLLGSSPSRELEQLVKEDLLPTNTFCKWTAFYQTINRCNIVIHYAPQVQELDPNYTLSEMKSNIAEATFIRSLCYFYLIRTFRDVPFTREPSIDDTQNYQLPATPFDTVLDNLVSDLEAVKDDAQLYFRKPDPDVMAESAERDNTARVTRPAVYALLADLYLWQGEWQKCIASCDYVIEFKQKEYENLKRRLQNEVYLFNDIPLLMEKVESTSGHAYNEIFGTGNSFESLFELTFDETLNKDNKNFYLGGYYANYSSNQISNGQLMPYDEFYGELPTKGTDLFSTGDCRAYESIYQASTTQYFIGKYAATRVTIDNSKANWKPSYSWRSTYRDNSKGYYNYAHWIVYRLTDVMLMKAEALVELGEDHFEEAFTLVNAVSKRAVNSFAPGSGEVLKFSDYNESKEDMEKLVMDERQRELMFEGKRWFDLLRKARRTGSNKELATTVTKKQLTNRSGIQIRLADPNALYLPYFRDELKVNPYLKQNPAYLTGGDADLEKN